MNKLYLRKNINDFVGEGYAYIPAWAPTIYGGRQWALINAALEEWQAKGFLKILKSPEYCTPDELCIEMLNFIDAKEPLPANWLSKTRMPPKWPHAYPPSAVIDRRESIGD